MERIKKKLSEIKSSEPNSVQISDVKLNEYGLKDLTLRPYQLDGVQWLIERYYRNHGCILGDEMGLGKTCQTITFLVTLYGTKESRGPHLILIPLSVLGNWQNELARFAPSLRVKTYVGSKERRGELREEIEEEWKNLSVVLTTYEILMKDASYFRKFSWHTLVVDEAHRLKNRESLLHQTLLEFDITHRILLTGTPVQNNLTELYSLLCFVAPDIFRERYMEDFLEKYTDPDGGASNRVSELHELLQPFLLRRIKSEVVKDLPKKSELVLYHGMSALQKKYYKAILMKDLEVFENEYQTNKTRLMNIIMQLRKCVNHPYLFDGVEPEPFLIGEHLVEASGKLVLIDQLLSYLKPRGHKVLLFSQMTRMLDILQDYLGYRGHSYERLDGSVRGEERYLAVQNFNEDEGTYIFLLSTKAGGQGLNLVAADTVIFVDSDYNPQNDLQAAARAHRIGQTRPVKILRLIGRSTVEEIILRRAQAKLKLTNAVIEGGQFSLGATSKEDLIADQDIQLQDILKFGVDSLFSNEESSIEEVDFETILGPTVDGEWVEEVSKEQESSVAAESMDVNDEEEEDENQNMYMFEGKDYSKEPSASDRTMFDQLFAAEKVVEEESISQGRALRKHKGVKLTSLVMETTVRKPRRVMTEEEKAERRKKMAENAARRAKEAEEAEVQRSQELRRRREKLWEANDYKSHNITLDSEGESEEEEEEEDEEEQNHLDINYVVGDVTHPNNTGDKDAIVVHCVDDSGSWGTGGLFSAIMARSNLPAEGYEKAGMMEDLALGDAHLLPIDDKQSREEGHDFLALIVAQHRDKRNNLSGIKLTALSQGLQRIYKVAKEKKASVHLPRIGHNTPGFNWYGTERLIRKILATRGIPTYIYYYPRKLALKRKATTFTTNTQKKGRRPSEEVENGGKSKNGHKGDKPGKSLPIFMQGVNVVFFHVPDDQKKRLSRYLVAYDGDVHKSIGEETTNVVVPEDLTEDQRKELKEKIGENMDVTVVTTKWLEECFSRRKKIDMDNYMLEET